MNQYPIKTLEISHSTMKSYHSCPRKLEFAKLYGFNLRKRSLAPEGGNALHLAYGEYLETNSKTKAVFKLMMAYPIDLCDNPLWKWSLEQTYGALLALINWTEQNTQLELAIIDGKKAIETPFLINIHHNIENMVPVVYRGYIDFIFYDRMSDRHIVLDLKGTGSTADDFTPQYKHDSQCLPYGLVLKSALDEKLDSLDVQYLVVKLDLLNPKIQHLEFHKSSQDIKEWTQDMLLDLTTIKTYIETQWFPRRSTGCFAFNKPCSYFNICDTRKLKTIELMLQGMDQPKQREFKPWITLDLEIAA